MRNIQPKKHEDRKNHVKKTNRGNELVITLANNVDEILGKKQIQFLGLAEINLVPIKFLSNRIVILCPVVSASTSQLELKLTENCAERDNNRCCTFIGFNL